MGTNRNTFRVAVRQYDPFSSAIQKQWSSFQQAEGVDLQLEAVSLDLHPLYETLLVEEGLKKGAWDVAFIPSDWFAEAFEAKAALDLAPYLASNPPEDFPLGWADNLLRLQRFDRMVLGVPYHDGPECLIYRKDLFESPTEQAAYQSRFGAPLRAPQSWQEFHQIARFFQRPDQGLYGTTFAAFPDGHNTVYDFSLQLWTRGGELMDEAGHLMLNTTAAVEALSFYRAMLNDRSAIHPKSREFDSVKSGLAFAAGQVAMMINWFGFASMAETIADSKVKGRVNIATIPHAQGGRPVSLSVYWVLGVGAGSPHRDVAYRFLRHCLSAKMDKLLTLEGGIGCRKSTWEDAEVNRVIPFYREMSSLHAFARELPRRSDWAKLATVIDQLVVDTINTQQPIEGLVARYQSQVA